MNPDRDKTGLVKVDHMASTIEIKEVSLTKDVLEQIREIDLQVYPNIGLIDWYLARYKPWHSAFVAMDNGKIVGYVASLPARKELYDAILNGVLVDDLGINPDMFLKESEYCYVGSVVLKAAYRGRNISRQLLDAFAGRYGDKKVCLIAVSQAGYHLAEHYFSLAKELPGGIGIFVSRV